MNFIDWLRRLGILRFGAESGVYHDAAQRPTSLQMDDVFDSEKDVVDLDKPREQAVAREKRSRDEPSRLPQDPRP